MATTLNAGTSTSGAAISADTTGILQLQSGSTPTTAVTIDASQNVGVGTTSVTAGGKLDVNGVIYASNGTAANPSISSRGETNAGLFFGDNGVASFLAFSSGGIERGRFDSSGNLLLNTTSTNSNEKMRIKNGNDTRAIAFQSASAAECGYIYINGGGTSTTYSTSSDYRLKEDIAPMTGALAKVAQLKPVTYTWKINGSHGQGFIAHELQAVVPDCVSGEKDAVDAEGKPVYQGIDTSFLVATLTAAIQEQQALIQDLQTRLEALEAK